MCTKLADKYSQGKARSPLRENHSGKQNPFIQEQMNGCCPTEAQNKGLKARRKVLQYPVPVRNFCARQPTLLQAGITKGVSSLGVSDKRHRASRCCHFKSTLCSPGAAQPFWAFQSTVQNPCPGQLHFPFASYSSCIVAICLQASTDSCSKSPCLLKTWPTCKGSCSFIG